MFIGRERELASLNRLYNSGKFEFVVLYGRRRVGKTALINHFIDAHEINRGLAVDEMVDQCGFSHAAAAVKNDKLKLVGIV